MRWQSLVWTLTLAVSSAVAPQLLFRSIGLDRSQLREVIGAVKASRSGGALDARAMAQLKALESGQVEDVPLEQLAAIQKLSRETEALGVSAGRQAEVAETLLDAFERQIPLYTRMKREILMESEYVRRVYRRNRPRVLWAMAALAALTFAVIVLGLFPAGRGVARFVVSFVFALAGQWLVFVSIMLVAYDAASSLNPWPLIPPEVLLAPTGFMLLTGLFLRFLDPNYPLWNALLRSLGSPIIACLTAAGLRLSPWRSA